MSLRHTIKSLISGPQTQAASGGGNFNQGQGPGPQGQYGASPYGYNPQAPVPHGGPGGSYSLPHGPPMASPVSPSYGAYPQNQYPPNQYAPLGHQQPQQYSQ